MKLKFKRIDGDDHLAWPENHEEISQDSPALSVFTDFTVNQPLVLDFTTPAYEAEEFMLKAHVKLKLVVDEKNKFLGVVALEDLKHPDFLMRMAAVYNRESLTIGDVMRHRDTLEAFCYADLERATIGDVITSLQDCNRQHCLVVDKTVHQIRGLISLSDVARKLKVKIQPGHTSSFAELYVSLNP
jgi:CBS domain containing-hemolysin-like protein